MGAGAGAVVSVVLGALFALWTTRSIVGPVQRAVRAADEISHGNLSVQIPDVGDGRNEMAQLLRSLDEMQQNLSRIVGMCAPAPRTWPRRRRRSPRATTT